MDIEELLATGAEIQLADELELTDPPADVPSDAIRQLAAALGDAGYDEALARLRGSNPVADAAGSVTSSMEVLAELAACPVDGPAGHLPLVAGAILHDQAEWVILAIEELSKLPQPQSPATERLCLALTADEDVREDLLNSTLDTIRLSEEEASFLQTLPVEFQSELDLHWGLTA